MLTLLVGYCFTKIFPSKPEKAQVMNFVLIFGFLFSVSNLFGLFSYINIPFKHLVMFNLVYFIEIAGVVFIFYKTSYRENVKKMIWYTLLAFFLLVVVGVIIQNMI